jgi:ABC-2 type transport system ATP-binding protein
VLSTPQVPEFLTAREFLKFFLEINAKRVPVHREVDEYFDDLRIEPADRDRLLKDYSQGMKNKMQMIVNIIANPAVLLLDEPLTSLDVVVAEEMKQLLRSMKSGRITILSTHLLDLAVGLCDEIVLLHDGRLQEVPKSNLDDDDFKNRIIAALSHGASLDSDADAGPAADAAIEAEVAADVVAEASVAAETPRPASTFDRGGEHA